MKTAKKKAPKKKVPAKKVPAKKAPKKSTPKKKNSLLDPTPAQIKHRNRLWVDALMKNKKKATGTMYKPDGGRCCLAVAQDVAKSCGVQFDETGDDGFPEFEVSQFFGWGDKNPTLHLPNGAKLNAADINDGSMDLEEKLPKTIKSDVKFGAKAKEKGLSHKEIAICVLNTFVRPSKKKWTHD